MNIPVQEEKTLNSLEDNKAYVKREEYYSTSTTVYSRGEPSGNADAKQLSGIARSGNIGSSGDMSDTVCSSGNSLETDLAKKIRSNYARIVEYMEAFPLCDHLVQHNVITMQEHAKLRQMDRLNHDEANHELLEKLKKRVFNSDILKQALEETKQSVVLKLLFDD